MSKNPAKVVMITGASAGVGRSVARRFAQDGAQIGIIARGADGLEATANEITKLGGEAQIFAIDVTDFSAVDRAAKTMESIFGHIDVWINNAMVSVFSPIVEMQIEEYRRVTEVTYLGTVNGTLVALKGMRARNSGTIIQVGSALAYRGIPLQSAYCGAKHAIQGFTESLRCELIHERSKVRVSIVHLPAMNTPQFGWVLSRLPRKPQPVPPIFQPEVAADAIHYAYYHKCREIHLGFPTVLAITANKIFPALLDHYLARTGYNSQQTHEPAQANRPNNLWKALPGDAGAHGTFSERARSSSWEWMIAKHKGLIACVILLIIAIVIGVVLYCHHVRGP